MRADDYMALESLYYADPWGPGRDNIHVAMLLAQTANLNKPKHLPPVQPERYMLFRQGKSDEQKIAALQAAIRSSVARQVH